MAIAERVDRGWRADLHCHSSSSDGTLTAEQLVELAVSQGLQGLSITDHDTVAAYSEPLEHKAAHLGLCLLPGVEFSAEHKGHSIHILSYGFLPSNCLIVDFCQRHLARRHRRAEAIVAKLKTLGIEISQEQLPQGIIGRPHIAVALLQLGIVSTVEEAFRRFLGQGALAYVSTENFSVEETLELIHKANGLAFLAHPHLIKSKKVVQEVATMPFDGIECYYGRFCLQANRPWLLLAQKNGYRVSGGSDFHGDIKPQSILGSSWVDFSHFEPLWQHYKGECSKQNKEGF